MPNIVNVSRSAISHGTHPNFPVLISINDDMIYQPATSSFKEVYPFVFLDIDENEKSDLKEFGINNLQAEEIHNILIHCLEMDIDVVVHCTAGLCRSGAVVEVAEMMGFNVPPGYERQPNVLVKKKLMKLIGATYD